MRFSVKLKIASASSKRHFVLNTCRNDGASLPRQEETSVPVGSAVCFILDSGLEVWRHGHVLEWDGSAVWDMEQVVKPLEFGHVPCLLCVCGRWGFAESANLSCRQNLKKEATTTENQPHGGKGQSPSKAPGWEISYFLPRIYWLKSPEIPELKSH